jgi:hypothetical protein
VKTGIIHSVELNNVKLFVMKSLRFAINVLYLDLIFV